MIKITHIEKNMEEGICKDIHEFLKTKYTGYFEIKTYGNGIMTSPSFCITSKI